MDQYLNSPVTKLTGVGATRQKAYAKLGIYTIRDLIYHFPRAFEHRGNIRPLASVQEAEKIACILTVSSQPSIARIRKGMNLLKFKAYEASDEMLGDVCEITFFNQDYLKGVFSVGATFRFYGKVERRGGKYCMTSPAYEPYYEGEVLPPLHPVYPLTDGLTHKMIATHIGQVLPVALSHIQDPLPEEIRLREGLYALPYALRQIHHPDSFETLHQAKRRLAYDEFLRFALGLATMARTPKTSGAPVCHVEDMTEFLSCLSYELTADQQSAIADIAKDMASPIAMSRMLVGDVGCGKTVCAAAAMYIAIRSGRQAALMAPTGILASQHAQDLIPMFKKLGIRGALLTGNTTAANKRKIYEALASPDPTSRLDFVVGTQALLSEGVTFASPGLVITDEQHRFGVNQRAALSEKNAHAHLLVMSATPIPRSLALVMYGDLDVSRIRQMPPGRQRVDTFVVDESYRARLDAFIVKNVAEGGQVYVVCPAVEEKNEEDEGLIPLWADFDDPQASIDKDDHLHAAVQVAEELSQRLPHIRVAYVHGKMKQAEKDRVMGDFANGSIQVLVSTTVIEVGVNVPNACLMLIENAERFGLSQLHQLRGRVGRGQRKSYCVLIRGGGGEVAQNRLEVMRTTYDGYAIAEQDLMQRGPGDFLAMGDGTGIRQSGGFRLKAAEGLQDAGLMERAFADAKDMLALDPTLEAYPLLRDDVASAFAQVGDILN